MIESNELKNTASDLLNKLNNIKSDYVRLLNEEKLSVRKDIIIVSLKDIIKNSNDLETMKKNLNQLIESLYK